MQLHGKKYHTTSGKHVTRKIVQLDNLIKTVSNSCTKSSEHALIFTSFLRNRDVDTFVLDYCTFTHDQG